MFAVITNDPKTGNPVFHRCVSFEELQTLTRRRQRNRERFRERELWGWWDYDQKDLPQSGAIAYRRAAPRNHYGWLGGWAYRDVCGVAGSDGVQAQTIALPDAVIERVFGGNSGVDCE